MIRKWLREKKKDPALVVYQLRRGLLTLKTGLALPNAPELFRQCDLVSLSGLPQGNAIWRDWLAGHKNLSGNLEFGFASLRGAAYGR